MTDVNRNEAIEATVHQWQMNGDERDEDLLYNLAGIEYDASVKEYNRAYAERHAELYQERVVDEGLTGDDKESALEEIREEAKAYAQECASEAAREVLDEAAA